MPQSSILILHGLDNPSAIRPTNVDHVRCYEEYAPDNVYIYADIYSPPTRVLQETPFSAVFLDATALGARYLRPRAIFRDVKDRWQFLSESGAAIVAMPQDDYDHSALLDEWLSDLGCHIIYTVVPGHEKLLYPRSLRHARIEPALTGYINDRKVEALRQFVKPLKERPTAVGQRVRLLPPQFGRYGQMKGRVANEFDKQATERGIQVDISTDPKDVFRGEDWYRFLASCRFCLGSEGGSSLWDPDGEIRDRIDLYLRRNPDATFEEVEATCFPGQDGQHRFSAISPRIFEATLLGCCLINKPGEYLQRLRPDEHYILLEEDLSNLSSVLDRLNDLDNASDMAQRAFRSLIEQPDFRYSTRVRQVFEMIDSIDYPNKEMRLSDSAIIALKASHEEERLKRLRRFDRRQLYRTLSAYLPTTFKASLPLPLKEKLRYWFYRSR